MKYKLISILMASTLLVACGGGGEGDANPSPFLGGTTPDSGDGTGADTVNEAPLISGAPTGEREYDFNIEGEFFLEITDPENDPISITFNNSQGWLDVERVTEEGNSYRVIVSPVRIGIFPNVSITVDDGTNQVDTEPFTMVVNPPDDWEYEVAAPVSTSIGDEFRLVAVDRDGNTQVYSGSVTEEGAALLLPYPFPTQTLSGMDFTLEWHHQGYVTYRKWIGSAESLYGGLDDSLTVPRETRIEHTPTAMSSAYFHLLSKAQGSDDQQYPADPFNAHMLTPSMSPSALLITASYHALAHNEGALVGLNQVLDEDFIRHFDFPRQDPALFDAVEDVRLSGSSLINRAYWQDLLNEQQQLLLDNARTDWSEGTWYALSPVQAKYAASNGQALLLSADGTLSAPHADGIFSQVGGSWTVENGRLVIPVTVEGESTSVSIANRVDVISLREELVRALRVDFATANAWAESAQQVTGPLSFTVSPSHLLQVTTVFETPQGDRLTIIEQAGNVVFENHPDGAVEGRYAEQVEEAVIRPDSSSQASRYVFNAGLFDVILPWPNLETVSLSPAWLDLYSAPVIRTRTVGEDGPEAAASDWDVSVSQVNPQELFFTQGDWTYTVTLLDTPALHNDHVGDVDGRLFSAQVTLAENGVVRYQDVASLALHPKSRCEVGGSVEARCDSSEFADQSLIWTDVSLGYSVPVEPQEITSGIIYVNALDDSQDGYYPVTLGDDCYGTVSECWVATGERTVISSTGPEHRQWNVMSTSQETWWPVNINVRDATVFIEGQGLVHFEGVRLDTDGVSLRWSCSRLNPLTSDFSDAFCTDPAVE